jgi:Fe-S-cluster containining protein
MSIDNELSDKQNILKCFMCGVCCRAFRVVVNIEEGNHLAKGLGLDWNTFKERYLEKFYVATDRFLIRQIKDNCIFLNQVNPRQAICRINDFKPSSCLAWQADTSKPECRTGLKQIWNLDISQDGEIKGAEADVNNFDVFINSID